MPVFFGPHGDQRAYADPSANLPKYSQTHGEMCRMPKPKTAFLMFPAAIVSSVPTTHHIIGVRESPTLELAEYLPAQRK